MSVRRGSIPLPPGNNYWWNRLVVSTSLQHPMARQLCPLRLHNRGVVAGCQDATTEPHKHDRQTPNPSAVRWSGSVHSVEGLLAANSVVALRVGTRGIRVEGVWLVSKIVHGHSQPHGAGLPGDELRLKDHFCSGFLVVSAAVEAVV